VTRIGGYLPGSWDVLVAWYPSEFLDGRDGANMCLAWPPWEVLKVHLGNRCSVLSRKLLTRNLTLGPLPGFMGDLLSGRGLSLPSSNLIPRSSVLPSIWALFEGYGTSPPFGLFFSSGT